MKRSLWITALVVVLGGLAGIQQFSSWSLTKSQGKPDNPSETKVEGGSGNRAGGGGQGGAGGGGRSGGQSRGGRSREAIPVLVATAVQKSVPVQIRAVGNVEAYATVAVKSQVTGVLTKAHFREGQDVKKGQLLFTVDPRPFEASLKQAEAALARDMAQLKNAREQTRRYAELVQKQYVSQEQYDQIRTTAEAMEAVVEADKAAVENAKVQLSYCYIYAPIDGQVGTLLVHEGNLVRVNDGTPLVVINQISPINVTFAVPEQHLPDLKRHMATGKLRVGAGFPSDDGRPEQGSLVFVDNAVDRPTGTIKLKAEFANTARRLWPGQFVNVALTLSTQSDAVVIPSEAVQVGQEGEHVFVVKPDKRVEMRRVIIARTNEGEAVIAKGLAPGEQVVREGQFLLAPDTRIEIKDLREAKESKDGSKEKAKGERKREGTGSRTCQNSSSAGRLRQLW